MLEKQKMRTVAVLLYQTGIRYYPHKHLMEFTSLSPLGMTDVQNTPAAHAAWITNQIL